MSAAWIVAGILYVLGGVLAYVALSGVMDDAPPVVVSLSIAWPLFVTYGIASDLRDCVKSWRSAPPHESRSER